MHLTCKNGEVKTIMWSNISEQFPVTGYSYWAVGVDITHICSLMGFTDGWMMGYGKDFTKYYHLQ